MVGVTEADRQRVVEELERRAAQGQLTEQELADRVHRARSVVTHAGLEGILLDLPTPTPTTPGSHRPWALPGALHQEATAPVTRPSAPVAPPRAPGAPSGLPPAPSAPYPARWGSAPASSGPRYGVIAAVVATLAVIVMAAGGLVAVVLAGPEGSGPGGPPSVAAPSDDATETVELAVGSEIRPGVYIAEPDDGVCHYERTELLPGGNPDLVVGERSSARLLFEVVPSDYRIRLRGCGPVAPYVAPATPATSLGDGDWLVGSDVVPGRYRVIGPEPDSFACRWSRASAVGFAPSEAVHLGAVDVDDPRAVVDLVAGERFSSSECGIWARE